MRSVFQFLILLSFCISATAEQWEYIGPDGGQVFQIVPDRRYPLLWYSNVSGQAYVSRDQARSWKKIQLPNAESVRTFLVHPATSRVLVAGYRARVQRLSLWVSKDLGKTFDFVDYLPEHLSRIYQDPVDENILYVISYQGDLLQSRNWGESWRSLSGFPIIPPDQGCTFDGFDFNDMFVAPWRPEDIYVSASMFYRCNDEEYDLSRMWFSNNQGQSWKIIGNFGLFHFDPLFPDRGIISWFGIKLITPQGILPERKFIEGLGSIISVPDKAKEIFATVGYRPDVYRSDDLGRSWDKTLIGQNERIREIGSMQSVDDGAGGLLMGNSQGLFYRNTKTLWIRLSEGMQEAKINRLLKTGTETIYALSGKSSQLWGLPSFLEITQAVRSDVGGHQWKDLPLPFRYGPITYVEASPKMSGFLLAMTFYGKLLSSFDGGESWSLLVNLRYRGLSAITFDPSKEKTVYVGHGKCLYRSLDNGTTLKKISCITDSINGIVVDRDNSQNIYIIGAEGPILKSKDGGKNFINVTERRNFKFLIALGPKDAYIASGAFRKDAWRTLDAGKTWEEIPNTARFQKIVSADVLGRTLLGLSDNGLFQSKDAGGSWSRIDGNIGPRPEISDITNPSVNPIYLATRKGVWKEVLN